MEAGTVEATFFSEGERLGYLWFFYEQKKKKKKKKNNQAKLASTPKY